jgi:hypothetical protein
LPSSDYQTDDELHHSNYLNKKTKLNNFSDLVGNFLLFEKQGISGGHGWD